MEGRSAAAGGVVVVALLGAVGAALGLDALPLPWLGANLHEVIRGEVYRSGRPTGQRLARWERELGLRGVVRLSGDDEDPERYDTPLPVHGVDLSAQRLPSPAELSRLLEALDAAPRPVLLHCRNGVDRSGLASALAVLLAGGDLEAARGQFAFRHGYPGRWLGSPLPGVLDAYAAWLERRGRGHEPDALRAWVHRGYVPGFYAAALDVVSGLPAGSGDGRGERRPLDLRIRVANRSGRAIPFAAEAGRGVRLSAHLEALDAPGWLAGLEHEVRVGADAPLAPGASAVFAARIPRPPLAGRYRLRVGLVDEARDLWFADMGSPPRVVEVALGPAPPAPEELPPVPDEADPSIPFVHPFALPAEDPGAGPCPEGARPREGRGFAGRGRWCERPGPDGPRMHGPARFRAPDGLVLAGRFRDGHMHGPWLALEAGGRRGGRYVLDRGVVSGRAHEWDRDEGTHAWIDYRAGVAHGSMARWALDGTPRRRGVHRRGLKHGRWLRWHPEGGLSSEGTYREGEKQGAWTRYHPGGAVMVRSHYRRGRLHGVWRTWSADGSGPRERVYRDGVVVEPGERRAARP